MDETLPVIQVVLVEKWSLSLAGRRADRSNVEIQRAQYFLGRRHVLPFELARGVRRAGSPDRSNPRARRSGRSTGRDLKCAFHALAQARSLHAVENQDSSTTNTVQAFAARNARRLRGGARFSITPV